MRRPPTIDGPLCSAYLPAHASSAYQVSSHYHFDYQLAYLHVVLGLVMYGYFRVERWRRRALAEDDDCAQIEGNRAHLLTCG
jgi:hypothetical protein